ncbi:MAG: hypothetical protein ACPGVU_03150 [Limisphaerales bacterium]
MSAWLRQLFLVLLLAVAPVAIADEALDALVGVLKDNTDAQLDRDILRGLRDSLTAVRSTKAPKDWNVVEKRLRKSPNAEVRELAKQLALKFGSQSSLSEFRKTLANAKAAPNARRSALKALAAAKDKQLVDLVLPLLSDSRVRVEVINALAQYGDVRIPGALLKIYPQLKPIPGRRAVLNVLVSRVSYAESLLDAVESKRVARTELTADLVRQLRAFKQEQLNARVLKLWGVVRESPEEKKREIAKYKKLIIAKKGDAKRGQPLYGLICGQCHTLFGEGGKVGPDITGANRSDLDYLLHNILDPNAEIPNDYRTTNIDTKDDRSLTGVVVRQDARSVTIVTAAERVTIAKNEIDSMRESELSMMPDALLQPLNEQQVRDLIAYLQLARPLK